MPRLDRPLLLLAIAGGLLFAPGCNRLTFVKPNLKKVKVEQVRRPVIARDTGATKARQSALSLVVKASGALQAGDVDAAEKHARDALRIDENSVDAHTVLAAIAERRGRTQEAGGWFKKAAELSGGRGQEVANYGAWLCANGRAAESLQYFDYAAASQSAQDKADALANAGACAASAGLDERADGYLRKALELDAESALALETLARVSLRRGRLMEARAFSERRLALQPINPGILRVAADVESGLGDARAAAEYRNRLQREFPSQQPQTSAR